MTTQKGHRFLPNPKLSSTSRSAILNAISSFVEALPGDKPEVASLKRSVFKKLQGSSRDPGLKAVAQSVFLRTEVDCAATNARIRSAIRNHRDFSMTNVLYLTKRRIAKILGGFKIDKMLDLGRFGPGSTYLCRGFDVSEARKFSLTDVTPAFNKIARGLLAEYPLWARSLSDADYDVCPLLNVVPGGRYSTVPKDQSTDRSIIIEPTINSFFQQAIGRYIRQRLLFASVDLNDQSTNQRLAQYGSIYNDLATVDLSSASDLISLEVVRELLPEDWFYWLDVTRSHQVYLDGNWVKLEKFSSMGNGFTFDLQSLIFYTLAVSICEVTNHNAFWVNVFGDDIVIPSGTEQIIKAVFADLGFQINANKSYFDGPFRESCGRDYHLGVNIRGVYVKHIETSIDLLKIHNRFRAWGVNHSYDVTKLCRMIRQASTFRNYRCPPSLGDVGFHSSFDECTPPCARDGWEGFRFRVLSPVLPKKERNDRFLLISKVFSIKTEFAKNSISLRQDPIGYTIKEVISDF